jgi:hypothetical protein
MMFHGMNSEFHFKYPFQKYILENLLQTSECYCNRFSYVLFLFQNNNKKIQLVTNDVSWYEL